MSFSSKLIHWYDDNGRTLPWRGIDDPYRIWLSEIILQQTRIEQGRDYYLHFINQYPTVQHLAEASLDDVLKSWQGLGYYSRARNLHAAAKQIMSQFGGHFPNTHADILSLKGVGRYTAAAIASFAFHLPYPVIDGNVYRVAARYFDIDIPIATNHAYSLFEQQLLKVIDRNRPDLFNQAIMDFGALCCKPIDPVCNGCIFAENCAALRLGKVTLLPVKAKPAPARHRYFYYIDAQPVNSELRLMQKRTNNDIWNGLYELPLIESDKPISHVTLLRRITELLAPYSNNTPSHVETRYTTIHKLTHQTIHATFLHAKIDNLNNTESEPAHLFNPVELKKLPVSRLTDKYLSVV